jgi:hypothetical protein
MTCAGATDAPPRRCDRMGSPPARVPVASPWGVQKRFRFRMATDGGVENRMNRELGEKPMAVNLQNDPNLEVKRALAGHGRGRA